MRDASRNRWRLCSLHRVYDSVDPVTSVTGRAKVTTVTGGWQVDLSLRQASLGKTRSEWNLSRRARGTADPMTRHPCPTRFGGTVPGGPYADPEINRQINRLWLAVWLMPIAICAIAVLWQISQLRPEAVRASSFVLVDEAGQERARVRIENGDVQVITWDGQIPRMFWWPEDVGSLIPKGQPPAKPRSRSSNFTVAQVSRSQ